MQSLVHQDFFPHPKAKEDKAGGQQMRNPDDLMEGFRVLAQNHYYVFRLATVADGVWERLSNILDAGEL